MDWLIIVLMLGIEYIKHETCTLDTNWQSNEILYLNESGFGRYKTCVIF